MLDEDAMRTPEGGWISASAIATFVYCERKYRLKLSPPDGYEEPYHVTERMTAGRDYHSKKGLYLGMRLLSQKLLVIAGALLILGGAAIWLAHL